MNRAERIRAARARRCPRCQSARHESCRKGRQAFGVYVPGAYMAGVHAERLALVKGKP